MWFCICSYPFRCRHLLFVWTSPTHHHHHQRHHYNLQCSGHAHLLLSGSRSMLFDITLRSWRRRLHDAIDYHTLSDLHVQLLWFSGVTCLRSTFWDKERSSVTSTPPPSPETEPTSGLSHSVQEEITWHNPLTQQRHHRCPSKPHLPQKGLTAAFDTPPH